MTALTSHTPPTTFVPCQRLLSAADLEVFPTHLPSGDVDYELDCGRLIIVVPPGALHGRSQSILAYELIRQGDNRGLGKTFVETGIVVGRNPDTVYGADAAFVANRSLPIKESPEGYLETIPDLVAESKSKNDAQAELERKAKNYLAAGVRVVWLLDPEGKTVAELRPGAPPRALDEKATLTVEDVIPGFSVLVGKLFRSA